MAENALTSPPYPSPVTTVPTLYRLMEQFRNWVLDQQIDLRDSMTALADRERENNKEESASAIMLSIGKIDEVPDYVPSETVWNAISVCDHYSALIYLRTVREGWDSVLRSHEDTWDSKLAIHKRFTLLLSAQLILRDAFVSPEVRELQAEKQMADFTRRRQALERHIRGLMTEDGLKDDEPEEPTEDNADNWF